MTADESSEQAMGERQIRVELGEVLDELQALPTDAFAQRSQLRDRQAELGRLLREIEIPGAEDIMDRWSELAGSKSPQQTKGKPFVASPWEGGSSGGC